MGSCHSCRRIHGRRRSRRMNPGDRQLKPSMVIMSLQPVVRLDTSSLMANPNFRSQVVWALMNALYGLLNSHFPPIKNATSMFYYKITDGEKKQLVDYQTYCFPFTNLLHYKQPCKLYFQEEGIFLSQPGHVNCCTFKANVSAVPIQFLHSFTLKESNVKAQDYDGNEVSTDHWVGPLNFQYWAVGHNDTRYKNWGHDIVFQDGPTGVTWRWGNFDVSPQDDSIFK